MARPTLYTPEIVKEICDRLCTGEPLEQICRDDKMPDAQTIHRWTRMLDGAKDKSPLVPDSVKEDIAHARDIGYDAIANEARMVARGAPGISSGDVARDKLIIETDLKLLAKWHAKKYGDRVIAEHTGSVNIDIAGQLQERIASYRKTVDHEPTVLPVIDVKD